MERRDKEATPLLFETVFTQLKNSSSYFYLNAIFIPLQFTLLLVKLYNLIDPQLLQRLNLPFPSIFVGTVIVLGVFVMVTVLSTHLEVGASLWLYFLLLLEALEMVFVQVTVQCFAGSVWCNGDAKYQLSALVMLAAFAMITFVRAHCYSPFHDGYNPLSMASGKSVLFLFAYALLISLAANSPLLPDDSSSKQIVFLLTCGLYAILAQPPHANSFLARLFSVCSLGLLWTSGLIWAGPLLEYLLGMADQGAWFWYCWGYSFPVVIGLGVVRSEGLRRWKKWREVFAEGKEGKHDELKCLYLQVAQLVRVMEVVRRSELRANSAQFKEIWELVARHNRTCTDAECSLKPLQDLRVQRGDELMEQKRFSKTVEKVLQFGLHRLVRQRDIFPNSVALNLQIANYQLQVFHQRSRGLQLYNREYGRADIGREEAWGMFFLRRKIQSFDASGEARAKGESEEQVAGFKHDIQVSVSLLAEFWYFLSDPKCNLKKLYDLANVLFPMKIRVDTTWRAIRALRSIECYTLYARYLIKMFNDKEKGLRILQQARKLEAENSQKEEVTAGTEAALNQEHGVIFLEFDGKNSGIMYQVNTACEMIFGYAKGELQGRKVNDIMPRLIAFHHDKILEHYQQTNRPRMMNKERSIWGRAKDGYLFPFTICIKPVRNYYSHTSEVYASVKRDLWVREGAFFFTDADFNLTDASASLLSFFPTLHGRLHLKKKVNIEELAPEFGKHRQRIIAQKEALDMTIERSFMLGEGRDWVQKVAISLIGEQVSVNVSGSIGFYFKIVKNSAGNTNEPAQSSVTVRQGNAEASNSYWMRRENEFRFVAAAEGTGMAYRGGIVRGPNETKELIMSRIQSSFLMTKQASINQEDYQRRDYAGDIKTRRLQGTAFREIHELSEQSDQNNLGGAGESEEEEGLQLVKPSELNAILSRENGSKHIGLLKGATIVVLLLSTLLAALEYALTLSHYDDQANALSAVSSLNSIQAQVMYLGLYANLLSLSLANSTDLVALKQQINELNALAGVVPYNVAAGVAYSDGSNQTMILSFAINKLISEAQLLATASSVPPSDLYFVQYNAANGLEVGSKEAVNGAEKELLKLNDQVLGTYSVYLGASAAAYAVILILKNLVLRAVLKKKAEILNVFFEIPRYACTAIQKECQRFIQRLTLDEQEQEVQLEVHGEDEEEGSRRYSKQKKRTIMGEEKTASNFVLVSLLLLAFLLLYPTLVLISANAAYSRQQYSFTALSRLLRLENEMAKLNTFIDTHYAQPSFPLSNSANASQIIDSQYANTTLMLSSIQEYLFYLGGIFSPNYRQQYNQLFFESLCDNTTTINCSLYGQAQGLNSLIFYYFDYLVGKYQLYNSITPSLAIARNASILTQQQDMRQLFKRFWRQFSSVLVAGASQLASQNESVLFGVMLGVCIVNMTVLLWGWLRFYNSLGQKIMATEYILTFIPIDQINRNPKIAKYIKEQVLRAQ